MSREIDAIVAEMVALSNASFPAVFANVDLATACLSGRSDSANFSTTCFGGALEDARDRFEQYQYWTAQQVDIATEAFDTYAANVAFYTANVYEAFDNMRAFYEGVTGWISAVGVSAPVDDWFNFGLADFYASEPAWPDMFWVRDFPGPGYLYPPALLRSRLPRAPPLPRPR